jgi:hypothetical protein
MNERFGNLWHRVVRVVPPSTAAAGVAHAMNPESNPVRCEPYQITCCSMPSRANIVRVRQDKAAVPDGHLPHSVLIPRFPGHFPGSGDPSACEL